MSLVRSVQDWVCRIRPICEWCPKGHAAHNTTDWLMLHFSTLQQFRNQHPQLVRACQPKLKRIVVGGGDAMRDWLGCGQAHMALRRAQFLPLGLSAIMHRIVCPSPGRHSLLIMRARGSFPRALNSSFIGEAGAQFRTQWPHPAFALGHDRRTDPTRIVFRPRPADSNRLLLRAGRL